MESEQFTLELGPEYAGTSRKSYRYTTEDWQILINILRRYSTELKSLAQQVLIAKSRKKSILQPVITHFRFMRIYLSNSSEKEMIILYVILLVMVLLLLLLVLVTIYPPFTFEFAKIILITSDGIKEFASVIVFLISVCLGGMYILEYSAYSSISLRTSGRNSRDLFRLELLEKDARVMSTRLESAVRLTITASDQLEISLAKKLEMDLLVDEAISALEYYHTEVGDEKKAYKFAKR